MKRNKLKELTLEELHKEKSAVSKILAATGIVMLILCCVIIYLIFSRKSSSLMAIVPLCFVTMLLGIIKLSQINTEIKSRNTL